MKKLTIEELKYYYDFDFKIEDLNELFLESEINRKMIADCINDIINNNDNIDLSELEYYDLYLYNKEDMIIAIKEDIINALNECKYNKVMYLCNELKNALLINTSNSDALYVRRCFMTEFNSINYLYKIWNNKNLMNYLLNL